MPLNPLKEKLAKGLPVMGLWSLIPSAALSEIEAKAGMDFAILDMEHGVWSLPQIEEGVRAFEGAGGSPLVRVPTLNGPAIQSVLDTGAHGIVVPQVKGVQECREAVAMATLPPEGKRGFNPFTRAGGYEPSGMGNSKLDPSFAFRSVIVESAACYEELDAILEIGGLDMVYLGVYDYSVSLGLEVTDPRVNEFVKEGVRKTREAGKAAGLMVRSSADVERALGIGGNFLVYSVDTSVIFRAMSEAVEALDRWSGPMIKV